MVREFYANVAKAINDRAVVRGMFVRFNASTINVTQREYRELNHRRRRVRYDKWET